MHPDDEDNVGKATEKVSRRNYLKHIESMFCRASDAFCKILFVCTSGASYFWELWMTMPRWKWRLKWSESAVLQQSGSLHCCPQLHQQWTALAVLHGVLNCGRLHCSCHPVLNFTLLNSNTEHWTALVVLFYGVLNCTLVFHWCAQIATAAQAVHCTTTVHCNTCVVLSAQLWEVAVVCSTAMVHCYTGGGGVLN